MHLLIRTQSLVLESVSVYMVTFSIRGIDGAVPSWLCLLRLISGTFLLAQTCMFIIVIKLRPHSNGGLI